MSIKGYSDDNKKSDGVFKHATVGRIGPSQVGLDTRSYGHTNEGSDAVEAGSTARVIVATAHAARVGDIISITSGTYDGYEIAVESVAANAITLESELPAAPAAAVTFDILRRKAAVLSPDGTIAVSFAAEKGAGAVTADTLRSTEAGRAYADSVRYDHTVPVTTGAWTELIASTAAAINALMIFDSSGQILELGTGAAASEARVLLIPPGGIDGVIPFRIAAGTRLSVRAVSANTAGGDLVLQGLT
jgi:hypothetical protein